MASPADPTRINLTSTNEVNYWCHTLNCTETRLRNAVLTVGPLVADVQAYLERLKNLTLRPDDHNRPA